jgi:hypothetical protein
MKLTKESMKLLLEKMYSGGTLKSENPMNWVSNFTLCGATIFKGTKTRGVLKFKNGDFWEITGELTGVGCDDIGENLSVSVDVNKRTLVIKGTKKTKPWDRKLLPFLERVIKPTADKLYSLDEEQLSNSIRQQERLCGMVTYEHVLNIKRPKDATDINVLLNDTRRKIVEYISDTVYKHYPLSTPSPNQRLYLEINKGVFLGATKFTVREKGDRIQITLVCPEMA